MLGNIRPYQNHARSTIRAKRLSDVTHAQAVGQWLSAYTNMGVKAYQKEHASRRPTAEQAMLTSHEAVGHTTHQSNKLFSWLFKACIAYQLYDWLQVILLDIKLSHCVAQCMSCGVIDSQALWAQLCIERLTHMSLPSNPWTRFDQHMASIAHLMFV